jgi:hypothetical protein
MTMKYKPKQTFIEVPVLCLLSQKSIDCVNQLFGTGYQRTKYKGEIIDSTEPDFKAIMQQTPNDYRYQG